MDHLEAVGVAIRDAGLNLSKASDAARMARHIQTGARQSANLAREKIQQARGIMTTERNNMTASASLQGARGYGQRAQPDLAWLNTAIGHLDAALGHIATLEGALK